MPIAPLEWIMIAVLLGLPLLGVTALVMLMRRARQSDDPSEQARIRELEERIRDLERQQKRP
ncbi:hypothetical protein Deipr_0763 [Deinococcus proteolyticus MRP]|uniref:Lipopolysaccharide assembly protein A domain-containing protein n=1 Tax=Deinococcus proteolyticus (strain ATCC 35074 / DSM 20540 / JCM 6276 / NBRC 101906 / NCIMB 13154 / VKM Ac-1939 / CCM 2703 / MRP) TaxID=693977 RepID=F0RLT1_DEIPM|nr:hypothetical protein [Deinococcus proteolyticus]ADY25920.1 hypothetical protein Deipr_0763 [Deinococcus proteolyticus MRP]